MIRVIHVTPNLSRRGGGVANYVVDICKRGADVGIRSTVFCLDSLEIDDSGRFLVESVPPTVHKLSYSKYARGRLTAIMPNFDLVHFHGMRSLLERDASLVARKLGVPYIISPHGQMFPHVLKKNRFIKSVINLGWLNKHMEGASSFLLMSELERDHFVQSWPNVQTQVIPIGLDRPVDVAPRKHSDEKTIVFLGILHPKKGLHRLAEAWNALSAKYPNWCLAIAGPDHHGLKASLNTMFARSAKPGSWKFLGACYGESKVQLLQSADLFVLPTDWENFGIVILEALAAGVPVITSNSTPWAKLNELDLGRCIPPTTEALINALDNMMSLSSAQRRSMGLRASAFVRENFNWTSIIHQLHDYYEQVTS